MNDMSHLASNTPIDVDQLRERLRKMTQAQATQF
jgi:hypothetical protein